MGSRIAAVVLCLGCTIARAEAAPLKAAVFDLELIDTSLEGERGASADQARRVALASTELRRLLAESGEFEPLDLAPEAATIERQAPLHKCNGCDEDIARKLGADVEVLAVVQKTSNLILSFTVRVKDLHADRVIRAGSVDIRGNNDDMWLRGIRWLVKNRLLAASAGEGR